MRYAILAIHDSLAGVEIDDRDIVVPLLDDELTHAQIVERVLALSKPSITTYLEAVKPDLEARAAEARTRDPWTDDNPAQTAERKEAMQRVVKADDILKGGQFNVIGKEEDV